MYLSLCVMVVFLGESVLLDFGPDQFLGQVKMCFVG